MRIRSAALLLLLGILALVLYPSSAWVSETPTQEVLPVTAAAAGMVQSCTPDLDGDGLCQEDGDGDAFADDQCPSLPGPVPNCGCPVVAVGRLVELVLVVDTSPTMEDELGIVCSGMAAMVADFGGKGIDLRYQILGIDESRDCTSDYVTHLVGEGTTNHAQDWGPAFRDLSVGYPWQPGRIRMVISLSNAGAEDGGDVWEEADTEAIHVAILAARSNGVRAAPVLASGAPAGAEVPAQRLARDTGGRVFASVDPENDLLDGISELIELAALDLDGDGVSDCRDAHPRDPCIPQPAFCLPAQDCGASSTPSRDDDRDGQAGEEVDDGVDSDGDGLRDEDVGGVGCAVPRQDCGVNSFRNLDDDDDGAVDEELDDGVDDDGDGLVDEDVGCPCPFEQDVGVGDTADVDDDHDGRRDEEVDDGLDDDGDGCVDEDVAAHRLSGLAMRLCEGGQVAGWLCPADSVLVKAGASAEAHTGLDGAYELNVDPGVYDLEFVATGYLGASRQAVPVPVSKQTRADALMIPENCSPPAGSCSIDYPGLASLWMLQTGALGIPVEVGEFLGGACSYTRRTEENQRLRAAAGFLFPAFDLLDAVGEPEPQASLETLSDCLENDLYTQFQSAGGDAFAAAQELHRYIQHDGWPLTLAVIAMPSGATAESRVHRARSASGFQLHVYDLQTGEHLGREGDVVVRAIASSYLVEAPIQMAFIHGALSEYRIEVVGTGAAFLDLALVHPRDDGSFGEVLWQQITTTISSTASVSVGLKTNQYRLGLDTNGDGTVDQESLPVAVGTVDYAQVYLPMVVRAVTPATGPSNRVPNTPAPLWPTDGLIRQSSATKLSWLGGDPDGDSVTYYVYLEPGDVIPQVMVCNGTTQPSCDPGMLDLDTQYSWQVWARDEHGAVQPGPVWEFTTGSSLNHPPNVPRNPSPPDGAQDLGVELVLQWVGGDADGDAVTYETYLGVEDPPIAAVCANTYATACDPGILSYETQYFWYVKATDVGGQSTTGPVWRFSTDREMPDFGVSKRASPTAVGPGDLVTYTVRFSNEGDVAGRIESIRDTLPNSFRFRGMASSSDVQAPPVGITGTLTWQGPFTVTAQAALDLVYSVQATTTLGSFANSVTATMGFGHPPPAPGAATVVVTNSTPITPTLPVPEDGAVDQSIDVDLSWIGGDPDGDSLTYDVFLGLMNPPTSIACSDLISPTCDPGTLGYETLYHWSVRATDEHGLASSGPIWAFTTEPDLRGVCFPAEPIGCNATDLGNNGGPGSTDRIDAYPCSPWPETGPEYAYLFVPEVSGFVSVTLSGMTQDLDIYLLTDAGGQCLADNCLDGDDASLSFSARAGQTYYLVVDGYDEAVSDYTIRTSCVTNTVQADLAILKRDTPDPVLAGTNLTYTLWLTNFGPSRATSVLVTDRLPDSVTFDAGRSSPLCSDNAGTVSCELSELRKGEETQLDIVATVGLSASGLMPNSVHVTSYEYDPFAYNNQSAVVTWAFGPGGVCTPAHSISCDQSDSGSNGGPGSTDQIDYYSCVDWQESGPEVVYTFVPDVSGQASVALSGLSFDVDLDLFVLRDDAGRCDSAKCLAFGDTEATFDMIAGQTYYLVVDGFEGAVGAYTLTVDCLGPAVSRYVPLPFASADTGHAALGQVSSKELPAAWAGRWVRFEPVELGPQGVCEPRPGQSSAKKLGLPQGAVWQ